MCGSRIAIICGGSGSSKFALAFDQHAKDQELRFVANVGDNFWRHGVYICPDVDILTYALAGKLDESKGWGVRGDTQAFLNAYSAFEGKHDWFNLGDADLALNVRRTELLKSGMSLSEITTLFSRMLGIRHEIIPATDDGLQTYVRTTIGMLHLQEYWVKNRGVPPVCGVEYVGASSAGANEVALDSLSGTVMIFPANPITSIMPTLSLEGVRPKLKKARVLAISPFLKGKAFSGPAAQLMLGTGTEPSSYGVAKMYSDFLDIFLVDSDEDGEIVKKIKALGIECVRRNIKVRDPRDSRQLVREIVSAL